MSTTTKRVRIQEGKNYLVLPERRAAGYERIFSPKKRSAASFAQLPTEDAYEENAQQADDTSLRKSDRKDGVGGNSKTKRAMMRRKRK